MTKKNMETGIHNLFNKQQMKTLSILTEAWTPRNRQCVQSQSPQSMVFQYIILRFFAITEKERTLKKLREKDQVTFEENPTRLRPKFYNRKDNIVKVLKDKAFTNNHIM